MKNIYYLNPILIYVCGMTGTLGIIFTAKFLGDLPFVSYWGRYSIMILCTHGLLLQVLIPLARKSGLPNSFLVVAIIFIVVMFSYQLLIPLMQKYLPYVTAQKDVIDVSKFV